MSFPNSNASRRPSRSRRARRGLPVQLTVLPGHHHFSILDELASPDGALTRELLALIGRA